MGMTLPNWNEDLNIPVPVGSRFTLSGASAVTSALLA